jgi:hypothetical protein
LPTVTNPTSEKRSLPVAHQRNTVSRSVHSPISHIFDGDNVNADDNDDDSVTTPLQVDIQSSSDSDDEDHHSRSRSRRRNKKTKPRTSAKILTEMMKRDTMIQELIFHKQPDKRLSVFILFRENLQTICKLTPELERTFRHIMHIRKPRTESANDALYTFIITHCDRHTRDTLVNFAAEHASKFQSGVLAFKHLERMYAPSDINATQKATTDYMTIYPRNEETISNFNRRFNLKLRIAVVCGHVTDAPTVIDHYLLKVQLMNKVAVSTKIEILQSKRETEQSISSTLTSFYLTDIQATFVRQEDKRLSNMQDQLPSYQERSYPTRANKVSTTTTNDTTTSDKKSHSKCSKANNVNRRQQGFNNERSNNRSTSETSRRPQTDITCYGCGKQGHSLNKCRTTSPKDRKAIWERMQENSPPQPSQAHATKTRRPPPNPYNSAQTIQASNRTRPQQYPSTSIHTDFIPSNTQTVQAPSQANTVRHMAYINAVHLPIQPRVIYYDTEVIIDSGASDHMATNESKLFQIYSSIHDVQLPDGSILTSSLAGLMRVSCTCLDSGEVFIVPLIGTILIPGFTICLWSVTSFNDSGHDVIFGTSTIRVIMNKDTPDEIEMRLNQPFQQNKTGRIFANMVHVSEPPRKRTKVTMNLLHQRLGHVAHRSLLAAQEAQIYNDVTIEMEPSGPCVDCQIAAIRSANRGQLPVGPTKVPGQIWFLDVIDNPSRKGQTNASYFPFYLNAVDSCSRYQILFGLIEKSTVAVISCLLELQSIYRPRDRFTLLKDVTTIHTDHGSQFTSSDFALWCKSQNIQFEDCSTTTTFNQR